MRISRKLYEHVDQDSLGNLNIKLRRSYLWLWHWLLAHESTKFLHEELDRIEDIFKDESLRNQEIVQLAWKAEALEYILESR